MGLDRRGLQVGRDQEAFTFSFNRGLGLIGFLLLLLTLGSGRSDEFFVWGKELQAEYVARVLLGDVVVVGETAWAVASIGWNPVPTDELAAAIDRH